MSEKLPIPNPESAEKKFIIDRESGYFKALKFATDPVGYLANLKKELLNDEFEEIGVGIQAMGEIAELEQILFDNDITTLDERVSGMLDAEYNTKEWAMCVFGLLKDAGYTKEQLKVWFEASGDEFTAEERFRERTMLVYLNSVYAEE